jgi:hypothetical protein
LKGTIVVSELRGDGDARLEVGGFLRYIPHHQRLTSAAVVSGHFLFGDVSRRAHHVTLRKVGPAFGNAALPLDHLLVVTGKLLFRGHLKPY